MTLDELAKKAEISKSYLWELENKESQSSPSAEKLTSIAEALEISIDYFLIVDDREPEEKHIDEAFFRGYQNLETKEKEQLRKVLKAFQDE